MILDITKSDAIYYDMVELPTYDMVGCPYGIEIQMEKIVSDIYKSIIKEQLEEFNYLVKDETYKYYDEKRICYSKPESDEEIVIEFGVYVNIGNETFFIPYSNDPLTAAEAQKL